MLFRSQARNIPDPQKIVMGIVEMDHVDLIFFYKRTDIPVRIPDGKAPVPVISRDQPVEQPHKQRMVNDMRPRRQFGISSVIADDLIYLMPSFSHAMEKLRRNLFRTPALPGRIQI